LSVRSQAGAAERIAAGAIDASGNDFEASMAKILIGAATAAVWFTLSYAAHAESVCRQVPGAMPLPGRAAFFLGHAPSCNPAAFS
jgi:hypothetical protein